VLNSRRKYFKQECMMKKALVALAMVSATSVAVAQEFTTGQVIGTITGAVIGSHFGGGSGKTAATVIGAVVGNEVGRNLSNRPPQVSYHPPMRPNYDLAQGSTVVRQRNIYQYEMDACVGDGYHNGEYNPAAAAAYCRGAMEAARQRQQRAERDAYIEGRRNYEEAQRQAYREGYSRGAQPSPHWN